MSGGKAAFDCWEQGVVAAVLLGEYQPERLPRGVRAIRAPGLADREDLTEIEVAAARELATRMADEVVAYLQRGENCLVQCDSGLNRSGLVCGLVLVRLGVAADEAIATIRTRRAACALQNRLFCELIREAACD
jgi:protein-tyrosine phosphatase